MADDDGLPPLRETIARHGLDAKKSLGQNFILDLNLTRRIARLGAPLSGRTVVEVGPGPGGLTRALLMEGAGRVVAIERDDRCVPALAEIAAANPGRLDVVAGDALEADWPSLVAAGGAENRPIVIANLPYGIATSLLVGWLTTEPWPPWWARLVLMFQKEVAERIVATPGTKAYGRLSVLSQWRARPRIALTLKPEAFTPPPKVSSAVVVLDPILAPEPVCDARALGAVTAAAFGQRRKMLRQSLKALVPHPELLLARAGIDPTRRAETLTVTEFGTLALVLGNARTPPGQPDQD
ncbi:MAG: 16S rRNA (adenine(1518)-N(6)/adenine(1519)-N(6))-dimethyltransferase RsmA [Hyphomicrobiaceae bacterium]|nr:16S rRNA (adenine(1518)-N(6)/adenine(1519)-N(6))-dimethyltransferase RsmA [Hyphomicrobiaceae bacterium]